MLKQVSLSIVIPCHNEEEVIESSYATIKSLLKKWLDKNVIYEYEIVMVNNGSTDQTLKKMLGLQKKDSNIIILDLRRNYEYQGSILSGLLNSTKEITVSIDADLQDDPSKIEEMIEKYNEGYGMVLGVRNDRSSDSFLKRFTAQFYYKILTLFHVNVEYNHGDFRLVDRTIINELKKYTETNLFLRGILLDIEPNYAVVYYKRRPRNMGETKFRFFHLFALGWDGISSFTAFPLYLLLFAGLVFYVCSLLFICCAIFIKLFMSQIAVPGWASTFAIISFFTGLNVLFTGIVGLYLYKVFNEVKNRPLFLIRNKFAKKIKEPEL